MIVDDSQAEDACRSPVARLIPGLKWLILPLLLLPGISHSTTVTEVGHAFTGLRTISGAADMPVADFDGDGLPDLALMGGGIEVAVQIIGYATGAGWKVKQSLIPFSINGVSDSPNLFVWNAGDGPHLFFARYSGALNEFDVSEYYGWPLALRRRWSLDFNEGVARTADVDNDGMPELILGSTWPERKLLCYSIGSGEPRWEYALPPGIGDGPWLHIAQLDADPALEIVVGGSAAGIVLDGATHAIEWEHEGQLAGRLTSGHFGNPSTGLVSVDYGINVFSTVPWEFLWSFQPLASRAIAADIDHDSFDELVFPSLGDIGQPNRINAFDFQPMSNRYFTTDSYPYQLAAADFDGDGQSELALSVETPYSTSPGQVPKRFQIVDPADGEEQFQIPVTSKGPYIVGGYLPTAAGVDTIIGSTDGGDYKGTIARVDAISGEIRWQTDVPDGATDLRNVSYLTVANVSGFSGPVIVAAGRAYQTAEAEILALSADDGSVLWHVGESDGSLPYTNVLSISAIDRDRDSIDESLLVCAGEHQLRQFDARNGNLLWESGAVDDGDCIGTLQLEIAGRVQLVALMSPASIVAFDAETHEESWRLEPDIEFDGAAYLPHGENGPELAVYDWQGKLQFFNLETRALLREYQSEDLFYMQGLAQPADGLIQDLIVPLKGAIAIVDGLTGLVRARSEQFGYGPSNRSPIKLYEDADRSTLIGIGTYVATFTHRLIGVGDSVFVGNFD